MLSVEQANLWLRKSNTLLSSLATVCVVLLSSCEPGASPVADASGNLELSASEITLGDGETLEVGAHLRTGSRTVELDPSADIVWSSSAPLVASVVNGLIETHSPGSALITATSPSGASASVHVEVLPAPAALVLLAEETNGLPVLSEYPTPVQFQVVDRNGNGMSDVSVDFSVIAGGGSIEPAAVQSDSDGVATGVWTLGHIAGEQAVEARVAIRPTTAATLSVSSVPGPPYALVTSKSSLGIRSGTLYRLSANVEDAFGNQIAGYPVIWSSSDPTVASVDPEGLVSPKLMGSTEITATLFEGSEGEGSPSAGLGALSAKTSVTVNPGEPATLEKAAEIPEEAILGEPLGATLISRVVDFHGNPVPGVGIVWEVVWGGGTLYPESPQTDGEGISRAQWLLGPEEGIQIADAILPADAVSEPARVPGKGKGFLRFEIKAQRKSGSSGDSGGTTVASVTVSTPDPSIEVGESTGLTVDVRDGSGNPISGQSVAWSSSSAAVASVSGSGYSATASGVSGGASLITAEVAGQAGWVSIDVVDPAGSGGGENSPPPSDPPVASVGLSASKTSLLVGENSTLTLEVLDGSGDPVPGLAVEWSSSNTGVASVSGSGYSATANGVSAGSSVVTANVAGQTASVSLDVEAAPAPPPPPPPTSGGARAFPGAEGWGATALNACRSRPLRVHQVINTNDSGSGSLRAAIDGASDDRFDVIVFRTGGTITLSDRLYMRDDCIYLAGQSAPGDGILLRGEGIRIMGNRDLVLRYLRVRDDSNPVNITDVGGSQRIVLDHLSTSWATDQNLTIWRTSSSGAPMREITIQRSLSSEAIDGHSTGLLIGGRDSERAHEGLYEISIHHNLFAHTGQRNPELFSSSAQASPTKGTEIVNNVQYNWAGRPISSRKNSVHDIVNNYSKPGPMSGVTVHRHAFYDRDPNQPFPDASIYIDGNVMEGESSEQWNLIRDWYDLGDALPTRLRRSSRLAQPSIPVSLQSASAAYGSVLADVGANARVDCNGSWLNALDPIDARVIGDVHAGTGWSERPPTSPQEAGGWPQMAVGSPCQDSDNDGLPNVWEERFFQCSSCADPASAGRDGYLLIEHYLNGTDPR